MNSGQVYQRILLRVNSTMPKIDKALDMKASSDIITQTSFVYKNKATSMKSVEFACSHPEIFNIEKTNHVLQPESTVTVQVTIRPMSEVTQGAVLVYAIDTDTGKAEVLSFSIRFSPLT